MRRSILLALMCSSTAACTAAPRGPLADPTTVTYAQSLGVDLSAMTRTRRGIYVQDRAEGTGAAARSNSMVRVHYAVFLPDGRQVESSMGSEPLQSRLNDPQFLIGEAIVGMKVGGRRLLVVPPERAYGRAGIPGKVPPDATLVFVVELVSTGGDSRPEGGQV
jgi:peptidylprolyl isomerase